MNRSPKIWSTEDICSITENVPENHKAPLTKMMMAVLHHDAYNSPK